MKIWKYVAAYLALVLFIFGGATYATINMLESAGGIKHIITEAGKEVKDIAAEIEAHEPSSN